MYVLKLMAIHPLAIVKITLRTRNANLMVALEENSGDHQSQEDLSPGNHEYP